MDPTLQADNENSLLTTSQQPVMPVIDGVAAISTGQPASLPADNNISLFLPENRERRVLRIIKAYSHTVSALNFISTGISLAENILGCIEISRFSCSNDSHVYCYFSELV